MGKSVKAIFINSYKTQETLYAVLWRWKWAAKLGKYSAFRASKKTLLQSFILLLSVHGCFQLFSLICQKCGTVQLPSSYNLKWDFQDSPWYKKWDEGIKKKIESKATLEEFSDIFLYQFQITPDKHKKFEGYKSSSVLQF